MGRNETSDFWFDVQGKLFVFVCWWFVVVCGRLLVVCGSLWAFARGLLSFVVVTCFSNYALKILELSLKVLGSCFVFFR